MLEVSKGEGEGEGVAQECMLRGGGQGRRDSPLIRFLIAGIHMRKPAQCVHGSARYVHGVHTVPPGAMHSILDPFPPTYSTGPLISPTGSTWTSSPSSKCLGVGVIGRLLTYPFFL